MNILLIYGPSRRGKGGFVMPLGLLYVGRIIESCGHNAKIFDPHIDDVELADFDDFGKLDKIIEDFNPTVIGFSGIATSYGRVKKLSYHIKDRYPNILQIAGGPLSSVYELLLTKTRIDLVFHGETEISLPFFLEKLKNKEPFYDTSGISYFHDGRIIKNQPPKQITDLDTVPFPAYHLIDIHQYLRSIEDRLDTYKLLINTNPHYSGRTKRIGNKKSYFSIVTSRGCTHRCLFCYRHMIGVRQHSVAYVIKHMKYLTETYRIEGFAFEDELFNTNPEWVLEFCDAIDNANPDIFYFVNGARVDKVNETMLKRLKETGCIEINYGHESGSDLILKEYRKGVTSQLNKEITLLTKRIGLICPVQIVIGSPKETNATINETVQFLKDVDAYQYSINYLIPLPETLIWKYVEEHKLIGDTEIYLDQVAEHGGDPLVNLTQMPNKIWKNWRMLIRKELKLHYYKKTNLRAYYLLYIFYMIMEKIIFFIPAHIIRRFIPKQIRAWF
ncbi:MAG: radical SAM protein [Nitrospinota bacterium]